MPWFRSKHKGIPTTEFHGWAKCHRPDQRNALGDVLFAHTFPFFEGSGDSVNLSPIDQALETVGPEMGFEVNRLPDPERTRRRYAGDLRSVLSLDRGRYFTICEDQQGSDSQTLANEMNAYCDPRRSGFGFVLDLADPNTLVGQKPGWLAAYISTTKGAPSTGLAAAQRSGLLSDGHTSAAVLIPYRVSELTVSPVLDLRRPDARQWLFETFGAGERDWLDFKGRALPREAGFFGLLATLMDRTNGGNDFTDLVGAYLRTHGVAALIFPSARTNVSAVFRDGELVQSGGWNLVDYRDASDTPVKRKVVWTTDWASFPDPKTRVEVAPPGLPHAGSFRVKENE